MPEAVMHQCPRCSGVVDEADLACKTCGLFTHIDELQAISRQALPLERVDPDAAAGLWERALGLLPPESSEAQQLEHRIKILSGRELKNDPPLKAALKTVVSMIFSILVYLTVLPWSWVVATGFVVLMLVHEMGHVFALKWYKLRASPPIFIPFMGAVIDLRQAPPNAKVEAVVGIGGPILGTIGALGVYLMAWYGHSSIMPAEELMVVAYLGFLLNLFNLLPVPPLDGGRITAAVSPWIWMLGILALVGLIVRDVLMGRPNFILILVLVFALPRVVNTLKARKHLGAYYDISPLARRVIGLLYLGLGIVLVFMYAIIRHEMRGLGIF